MRRSLDIRPRLRFGLVKPREVFDQLTLIDGDELIRVDEHVTQRRERQLLGA